MSVGTDYLVSDGKNKYSVPFDLIGEKVDIRLTPNTVEKFYRTNRVASHIRRNTADRNPIINPDHLTPEHRKYLSYNAEDFTQWANTIGENTKKIVTYFLTAGKEAEQGFKACASLTKLGDRYSSVQLEHACGSILSNTATPSIRLISTVLKSDSAKAIEKKTEALPSYSNEYGITRGAAYYSKNSQGGGSR